MKRIFNYDKTRFWDYTKTSSNIIVRDITKYNISIEIDFIPYDIFNNLEMYEQTRFLCNIMSTNYFSTKEEQHKIHRIVLFYYIYYIFYYSDHLLKLSETKKCQIMNIMLSKLITLIKINFYKNRYISRFHMMNFKYIYYLFTDIILCEYKYCKRDCVNKKNTYCNVHIRQLHNDAAILKKILKLPTDLCLIILEYNL